MRYITDFADQAVILPLVLAVAAVLWWQGWKRGALIWLVVTGGTFAAILTAKLVFLGCAPVFGPLNLYSPSGHVAASSVVAGGLAAILTGRLRSILPAALVTAIVISISRILLGAHTVPEVIVGGMIGLAGAAALMHFTGTPPRLQVKPLVAVVLIVATLFHGLRLPAEAAIRRTAFSAAQIIPACRGAPEAYRHRGLHERF
ncbi:MAG TPA: phosphatase PAP2 family protein [Rhodopila sp.]|nr:phosphatase PAP2 family protein [Rhodopila sp.]